MSTLSRQMDRMAVLLSGVCLLHCLLLPVVLAGFPVLALGLGGDEHFHEVLLWGVIPVSVLGLSLGFRQHRKLPLVIFGIAAMTALAFASTWGHDNLDTVREGLLMVASSIALAAAHVMNLRAVRHCGSAARRR